MKLKEVTRRIHELDAAQTIYAKRPWTPYSEAKLRLDESGRLLSDLANDGYLYFLEVEVARDIVPEMPGSDPQNSLEQWCFRLIDYAENDA